jgi:hypothetical protein
MNKSPPPQLSRLGAALLAPFTFEVEGSILATNSCEKSQRSTECRAGYLLVLRLQFPPTGKVDRLGFRCVYGICIILTQSHNLCIITIALSGSKYIITRFSRSEWHEWTGFLPSAFRRTFQRVAIWNWGYVKLCFYNIVKPALITCAVSWKWQS